MKGLIIGDLAAWTWQNDRNVFYSRLVSDRAVLSEFGVTAIAMVEPIWNDKEITADCFHGHLQKYLSNQIELSYDVETWLKNPLPFLPSSNNQVNILIDILYAICGWSGDGQEDTMDRAKKINTSLNMGKEAFYASMILPQLIWLLRNGYSKKDAIQKEGSFKTILDWDKSSDGPLGAIARAWDSFYRAFDFTSTIHSAVKSPVNPRLTACIAGALAEAMYGCEMGFLKKKYTSSTTFLIQLPEDIEKRYQYELAVINQHERKLKVFFPKNSARTNVERHIWTPVENIYADKKISYELHRRILKAFYTSFDDRYGFYLDEGWVYVYRSFHVLCRFKFVKDKYGVGFRIIRLERSEEEYDYKTALLEAMYSVKHRWYLASDEPAPENMQYCKYFRGEDECPEVLKGTVQGNFWHGEMMFVRNRISMEMLKQDAENVLKQLKGEKRKKFMSYTEEQRAIFVYIELLFGKWCPYDDLNWIWEY